MELPRSAPTFGDLDMHLLGEGTHLRAYEKLGAHPQTLNGEAGVTFAVWAPNARTVSVVGDFNGWDGRAHPMTRFGANGFWGRFIPGLVPGMLYKFEIHGPAGELLALKADPFAFRCEHAPGTASVIHGLPVHSWGDAAWLEARRKAKVHAEPLSIYELHLGSWRRRPDGSFMSYQEIAADLAPYASWLGFTHVQLLPVTEHPYDPSWGYQPLGLFAPTSRFGGPEDFKAFVDTLHQAGLGVILDWVPAHFPEDAHGLSSFDGTHLYEHADPRQGRHMDWGTLIYNYGRAEVQNYLVSNALFWLDQFHVDGLRVDAVASMLYLDYSREPGQWIPNRDGGRENLEAVAFLRRLNEVLYAQFPDTFTVAEESTAWPGVTRPTDKGGLGFGFKWDMGWMHDTLRYLGQGMMARPRHHDNITFSMVYHDSENYVLPLSHDEVVHGKRSLYGRMPGDPWERMANLRLLYAWLFAHGGKKLLFMGGEFAQKREWNQDTALDWDLLDQPAHKGIHDLICDLNALYRRSPALYEGDCQAGGFSWIDCGDRFNSVLTLLRSAADPGDFMVIAFNFTALSQHGYRVGVPAPGAYVELMNSDSTYYGGRNQGNTGRVHTEPIPAHGYPQSLNLTLPPLAALFLKPE